ncbi:MAG: endolytic transglycosylase MltG, partial [Acidobacteria bacterium]|nr:endolytic transglycosylase MltG [Acidobacteriota bacterium]
VGWFYRRVGEPYRGYSGAEQFVEIPSGIGPRAIGERLIATGVVRDEPTYRAALWLSGDATRLKAGEYRFDQPMTAAQVIDKIVRGDVYVVNVTFREGLTIGEMAKVFEAQGLGQASAFVDAARDPAPIRALDPAARDLEGYLFPETYSLPRRTDAAQLVRLMVERFMRVFDAGLRQAAEKRGLSVRQAVSLASLVEKETARSEERPLVAAVYANRLRLGMPLQCDPTVIYALQLAGRYRGNIRKEDLTIDSPYNTYRYPGLPPGPIAAPGRGSLEAAVNPADVDFLYFVSRNDGSHEFARSLAEHNRNVQKYQIQFFRDRRAGKAIAPRD